MRVTIIAYAFGQMVDDQAPNMLIAQLPVSGPDRDVLGQMYLAAIIGA